MKPRRVIVEIELETAETVKDLKAEYGMPGYVGNKFFTPIQVQVNAIRNPEPKKPAKRR